MKHVQLYWYFYYGYRDTLISIGLDGFRMLDPSTGRSTAKEAGNKLTVHSHENLARKLQEELERNRKSTSGSKSNGSGGLLREVACPVCTVHLQVNLSKWRHATNVIRILSNDKQCYAILL